MPSISANAASTDASSVTSSATPATPSWAGGSRSRGDDLRALREQGLGDAAADAAGGAGDEGHAPLEAVQPHARGVVHSGILPAWNGFQRYRRGWRPASEGGLRGGWRARRRSARTGCTTSVRRWPTSTARSRSGSPSWAAPAASRRCSSGPTSARSSACRACTIDAAFVDLPGGVILELLDYRLADRVPHTDDTQHPGNVHLCFRVEDADAAWAPRRRRAAPGRSTRTARWSSTAGRTRARRSAYLRDPDGISIELFQLPPHLVERRYERLAGRDPAAPPRRGAAGLRPVGTLEYHGPHLPLGSTASRRTSCRCAPPASPAAWCCRRATSPRAASTCRAR